MAAALSAPKRKCFRPRRHNYVKTASLLQINWVRTPKFVFGFTLGALLGSLTTQSKTQNQQKSKLRACHWKNAKSRWTGLVENWVENTEENLLKMRSTDIIGYLIWAFVFSLCRNRNVYALKPCKVRGMWSRHWNAIRDLRLQRSWGIAHEFHVHF